ncbi:peptidyl-prolyl cis-trans isomerase B (cyclophilin B) [Streptomyces sp. 1114.5]|uniref:peptidylprolyl isomerase n=1 Tax=Streptomyces sp. 1114.5 TaxID=1938830 RepID=UPI000EB2D4AB|nr:peptidylprolyl isomerase [Streptomyces sp. 1114.5]RKT18906.1 peptidyl-prolyl cis-trans isomerase B (cyclophilin B) [Streptomyces sp. 1114.5]
MVSSEQRRRQLARDKYERQMQRRAEAAAARKRRNTILGASLAVVVLAGGGTLFATGAFSSDDKDKSASAAGSAQAAPTKATEPTTPTRKPVEGCTDPAPGAPNGKQWQAEPAMSIDPSGSYTMALDTNCGKVTIALDAAKAPHTVNSFAFLAGEKYLDHTKCHRLTTDGIFVLQCGDPTASATVPGGTGGPGYKFADENLTGATYPAGTVAMANSGPGTNGSQFFLVYKDTQLPPKYTPFGKITGGLDVVQKIAAAGTLEGSPDGHPMADVTFNSATVSKG